MGYRRRSLTGWRRLVWLLVAGMAAAASAEPAPPLDTPHPASIRVVSDNNYPPYLFLDADGNPQGYVVDMWRLFEVRTGIRIELVAMDWASAQREVLAGRADAIDMIFRTPGRDPYYDFTSPYATQTIGIYVDRSLPGITDANSLRGLLVGVQRGDACIEALRSRNVTRLQYYTDYQQIINAALKNEIRIFCMDDSPATYFLYRNDALDRFPRAFALYQNQFRRAVRKGNDGIRSAIEQGMARITADERTKLRERWLERPSIIAPWLRIAGIAAGVTLLVVALLGLWIWTLGRTVRLRTRDIRSKQDKLRALFDASPDAIWVKDRSGTYLECNERVFDILHLQHRDVIGRRDEALLPAALAETITRNDREALRAGRQQTHLLSLDTPGGRRTLEVITVPLRDPEGTVDGLLGSARDVTDRLRDEAQLRLWAHAFRHAAFGVAIFDVPSQTILMVNPTFARERGYAPEELAGQSANILYPPELIEERIRSRRATAHLPHFLVETEQVTRDGRRFPVLLDCSNTHDADGNPQYVIVYAQDISARKQAERELRLAAVAFQTQEALVVLGRDGVIQRVNEAFTALTGFTSAEVTGHRPSMLQSQRQERDFYRRMWDQIQSDGCWIGEQWITTRQGQLRVVRMEVSSVRDDAGGILHYVCAMSDLTSEREAQARAEHATLFDPLTDLPNRNFLVGHLAHRENHGTTTDRALLLIDIDHFKRINDLRGHTSGDDLILAMAQRLRDLQGGNDLLCRLGGGTFALLVACDAASAVPCAEYAPHVAERVLQAIREPFWLDRSAPVHATASIGWALLRPGEDAAHSALKEAELAMYGAKASGRDRSRGFEPGMLAALERQETMRHDLQAALSDDASDLSLHLQLQVDTDGNAIGAEALLRWTRPEGERVGPDTFIPFAEESGLIVPLGRWVLRKAAAVLVRWSDLPALRSLDLAINVSAKQFAHPAFTDDIRQVLEETGADPRRLMLEITETAILGDIDEIAAKLHELRDLGIRISLDDFGTGYSSLSYLSRLPLDQLKIDRSFIARLPEQGNDATVAQTIIGMGKGLSLEVIAEGVETPAQRDFLRQHGCNAFQGYLFARPVPLAEFEAMMAAPTSRH